MTPCSIARGREALLLRGGAAGGDSVHAPRPAARLRLHPRARRQGRLLRQLPEVQGPPVDHGHLLDEELHRDPRRPSPAHRPRPPAQREDRRPAVHHPAAAHRHRRHHRGRGPHAHPHPLPPGPRHAGQQPGRLRRRVLPHHRRRPAERRPHPPRPRARLRPRRARRDRRRRRRHPRRGAQRAKGFKVGLIRVEKYFEGTAITAYAGRRRRARSTDYCWGGCPGAIEEAIEILRLFDDQLDAKMPRHPRRLRRYEGPHRREARREGGLHRRLRHLDGDRRRASSCRFAPPTRPRHQGPAHHRRARRHLRQDGQRDDEAPRRQGRAGARALRGLPRQRGRAGPRWSSSRARRTHFSTRREPRLQQGLPAVARHHGHEAPPGYPLSEARCPISAGCRGRPGVL
jgi:hypothetical protein